jgi:hypothetical protein
MARTERQQGILGHTIEDYFPHIRREDVETADKVRVGKGGRTPPGWVPRRRARSRNRCRRSADQPGAVHRRPRPRLRRAGQGLGRRGRAVEAHSGSRQDRAQADTGRRDRHLQGTRLQGHPDRPQAAGQGGRRQDRPEGGSRRPSTARLRASTSSSTRRSSRTSSNALGSRWREDRQVASSTARWAR